jgi:tetratricopeptide (TPR) repeat protein
MAIEALRHALLEVPLSTQSVEVAIQHELPSCSGSELRALADALHQRCEVLIDRRDWENALQLGAYCRKVAHAAPNITDQDRAYLIGMDYLIIGNTENQRGRYDSAWMAFTEASRQFRAAESDIMWARTQIGRLSAAKETGRLKDIQPDLEKTERILIEAGPPMEEFLFRWYNNRAAIAGANKRYDEQYDLLSRILHRVNRDTNPFRVARTFDALAMYYVKLGRDDEAIECLKWAAAILAGDDRYTDEYFAYLSNIANAERNRGRIQSALRYLNKPLHESAPSRGRTWIYAKLTQVECYRTLNWYEKAEAAARELIEITDGNEQAIAYRELGLAQAEQNQLQAAQENLHEALTRFIDGQDTAEAEITRLRQVQIAAQQTSLPNLQSALDAARALVGTFRQMWREKIEAQLLVARLLVSIGRAHLQEGQFNEGQAALKEACAEVEAILEQVENADNGAYSYAAITTLGNAYAARGDTEKAEAAYRRAIRRVEEMQRDLAIVFRPGFLGDKGEALHHLIRLYLARDAVGEAFDALERAKSTVFWGWISAEDPSNWDGAAGIQTQKQRLDALHAELFALYHRKRENLPLPPDFAEKERTLRNQIELAVQQIFTTLNGTNRDQRAGKDWAEIAQHLPPKAVLVMYYDDNRSVGAFTLSAESGPQWHPLRKSLGNLQKLLRQWNTTTRAPLMWLGSSASRSASESDDPLKVVSALPAMTTQRMQFDGVAEDIGAVLLGPLRGVLAGAQHVIVVPYQQLHNIPFNLLRDGGCYLIEKMAVTVLPTASLIVPRPRSTPRSGAAIFWDDNDGFLNKSLQTAQAIQQVMPNSTIIESKTLSVNEIFDHADRQILQIISHGEFHLDFPEASRLYMGNKNYISLIDLLYRPLTCDLAVLTACNVGQGSVRRYFDKHAVGDDVLGFARSFLHAGAGALLISMWEVVDGFSIPFLEAFYKALMGGASKAEALRTAQLSLLKCYPKLHPIFWGAFQLIGDPHPLPAPAGHASPFTHSFTRP